MIDTIINNNDAPLQYVTISDDRRRINPLCQWWMIITKIIRTLLPLYAIPKGSLIAHK